MKLPSASELNRALACPASCVLPPVDEESEDAAWGTIVDHYITRAREIGRDAALAEIVDSDAQARCDGIDVTMIPQGAEAQVTVAYDPVTDKAERIYPVERRGYPEDRFCCTGDWMGVLDPSTAFYLDTKTGLPCAARDSLQLRGGGLFLARFTGANSAMVGHLRLGWNNKWHTDKVLLDDLDLDAMRDDLRAFMPKLREAHETYSRGKMPKVCYGPHCKYCRCKRGCFAITGLVTTAASTDLMALAKFDGSAKEDMVKFSLDQFQSMEPADIGAAYERTVFLRKFLEAAEEAAKMIGRVTPVPLSGGRELREVDKTITVVDPIKAVEALSPLVGEQAAIGVVKCSQTAIEDALKVVAARGKFSALKRQIMQGIENKGGIYKATRKEVRAVSKR